MEDEVPVEDEALPNGSTPIWIDVPCINNHLQILMEMKKLTSSRSVTVLYDRINPRLKYFCREEKWDYREWKKITGCEDEVIIAIDIVQPETISRPHNLLVMVTTPAIK